APGDDSTELWGKGRLATLTWSGEELPPCAPSGAIIPPYRAAGNEPFWSVQYDGWQATLARPGEPDSKDDATISASSENGHTLATGKATQDWQLATTDGLCVDSMSGLPHPQKASLSIQGETLQGCGGNPERLLQGASWQIRQFGGQATV